MKRQRKPRHFQDISGEVQRYWIEPPQEENPRIQEVGAEEGEGGAPEDGLGPARKAA